MHSQDISPYHPLESLNRELPDEVATGVLGGALASSLTPGTVVWLEGDLGAGKTTLTKVLAGEGQPASGQVTRSGTVGYLPQDPRTGDLTVTGRDRILSARGLDHATVQVEPPETDGCHCEAD